MINILSEWKKYVQTQSFEVNPNRKFPEEFATIAGRVESDFLSWFGEEEFLVQIKKPYTTHYSDHFSDNWLVAQLRATDQKCILSVVEFWTVIKYYSNQNDTIIGELITYQKKKNYRHFRNYYFELWTAFKFVQNRIPVKFKPWEGIKELDMVVEINGEECLVECKKIYHHTATKMKQNYDLLSKMATALYKDPESLDVCVEFKEGNMPVVDDVIKQYKTLLYRMRSVSPGTLLLPLRNETNDYRLRMEVCFGDHTVNFKDSMKMPSYLILRSRCRETKRGPMVSIDIEGRVSSSKESAIRKLKKAIKDKRSNRSDSIYKRKIYLFDSENYAGSDRGLFMFDGFNKNDINILTNSLSRKPSREVVILIIRDTSPSKAAPITIYSSSSQNTTSIEKIITETISNNSIQFPYF